MSTRVAIEGARQGSEGRLQEAMKLSLPIIVSQLLTTLGGFIAALMLSNVNQLSFATGLLTSTVHMAIITVVFGLMFSVSALMGKVIGEAERGSAHRHPEKPRERK